MLRPTLRWMEPDYAALARPLRTRIINFQRERDFKKELIRKREERIREAQSWEPGPSVDEQKKYVVAELPGGTEVYFLKPGKESQRKERPNIHDMAPQVGDYYTDYTFRDTWSEIAKLSVHDLELFKLVMVLIYRNTYLLDHRFVDDEQTRLRYVPNGGVLDTIEAINGEVGGLLPGPGLLGLLHFLDLLGWNEDVKYHSEDHGYDYWLSKSFYTGRMNTMLSCINIPYRYALFIHEVLEHADDPTQLDFKSGLDTMQDLAQTRGISKPSQGDLAEWFSPILYRPEDE